MLFQKYAKMALTTIPFVKSILQHLYYVENVLEYGFN